MPSRQFGQQRPSSVYLRSTADGALTACSGFDGTSDALMSKPFPSSGLFKLLKHSPTGDILLISCAHKSAYSTELRFSLPIIADEDANFAVKEARFYYENASTNGTLKEDTSSVFVLRSRADPSVFAHDGLIKGASGFVLEPRFVYEISLLIWFLLSQILVSGFLVYDVAF